MCLHMSLCGSFDSHSINPITLLKIIYLSFDSQYMPFQIDSTTLQTEDTS